MRLSSRLYLRPLWLSTIAFAAVLLLGGSGGGGHGLRPVDHPRDFGQGGGRGTAGAADTSSTYHDWLQTVWERIRLDEYHITWQEATYIDDGPLVYQAPNRAHDLRTYFTSTGIQIMRRTDTQPTWRLEISLEGYGSGTESLPVAGAGPVVTANHIEYRRPGIVERYVNDDGGLEATFVVDRPAPGSARGGGRLAARSTGSALLRFRSLASNLYPEMSDHGRAVEWSRGDGLPVLQLGRVEVADAAGRELAGRLSLGRDRISVLVDDAGATYPLTVQFVISSQPWTADPTDKDQAQFGFSVGTAGDVNNDGYDDVIIGANLYDGGAYSTGKVFVYHGSASGLGVTPDWTVEGSAGWAYFGYSVSTAGDVNKDGYDDVIIGAMGYGHEGAYVYHGGALGLSLDANWAYTTTQAGSELGGSVGTAGDVNGDGFDDVIVGAQKDLGGGWYRGTAFVFHGSPGGLSAPPSWTANGEGDNSGFGFAVSTAGDVNQDGYDDVIVGAPYWPSGWVGVHHGEGKAYLYLGSAGGLAAAPAWTADPVNQQNAHFGYAVGTAGDVNGDGYADVIVGAPYFWDSSTGGRVYVYHGSSGGLDPVADWTRTSEQGGALLGQAVGTAGDLDLDGFSDVVIGAPNYRSVDGDDGRAAIYKGSPAGLVSSAAWTAGPVDQPGANFGHSVGTAGDVNGDGTPEVIIGAPGYDGENPIEGRAYVYYSYLEPPQAGARLGFSVGGAGDVNGDSFGDVIVGAPYFDRGQVDEGCAFLYHGSADGLSASPDWTGEGDQANAHFGYAVGTAGDANDDGYDDVIVGAPEFDAEKTDEGRAYVFTGTLSGLSPTPAWTADPTDQEGANYGFSVGTAGDVNGDAFDDVIVGSPLRDGTPGTNTTAGAAYVYHGSATGPAASADWMQEGLKAGDQFGYSVATAGDVNGDACADVIIGAPYSEPNPQANAQGSARIYYGSPTGLGALAMWSGEGDRTNARFGFAVGTAGDVNDDGYSDVVVGAPYYSGGRTFEGKAYVYHGRGAQIMSTVPDWTAEGDAFDARFGSSVGTAGDFNGDGIDDVIIGAPRYWNGEYSEGRAYVYHGSSLGLSTSPNWTMESDQENAQAGASVAGAGDIDNDGIGDVIFGAPLYDGEYVNQGRLYVVTGTEVITLELMGLEVTQAVQNWKNEVILVENKLTYVRAHVRSTSNTVTDVTAQLVARRDSVELPLSPNENLGGPIDVLPNPSRGTLEQSFTFMLPLSWLTGTVQLEFQGVSHDFLCREPAESGGVANDCRVEVTFDDERVLPLEVIGIKWTEAGGAAHEPSEDDLWAAVRELGATFPIASVDYSAGPAIVHSGPGRPSTRADFDNLIERVREDRCNGQCTKFYLGLLIDPPNEGIMGVGSIVPGYIAVGYLGDLVPSHEMGHAAGRYHTVCAGDEKNAGSYPYPNGRISNDGSGEGAFFGFDIRSNGVYPPDTGDVMSYCDSRWVSDYTYEAVYDHLQTHPPVSARSAGMAAVGPAVLLSGLITPTAGTGALDPAVVFDMPWPVSPPAPGAYAIRFEDGGGQVIASHSFEPSFDEPDCTDCASSDEDGARPFVLALPWDPRTVRVTLLDGQEELDARIWSANAPTVTVLHPDGGEVLSGDEAVLSWTAGDADGDPLEYLLQYSADGGASWRTIASEWVSTTYALDLEFVTGTDEGLWRVLATDGLRTAYDESDGAFSVERHPPYAHIEVPAGDRWYVGDELVLLRGMGYDIEDGALDDSALTWQSDLDGELGAGRALERLASTLTEGTHAITLTAQDGDAHVGTDHVTLQVNREPPALPSELSVAPDVLQFCTVEGFGPVSSQMVSIHNAGDGPMAWSGATGQAWIATNRLEGVAPQTIYVVVDPVGLPVGKHTGSITVTAPGAAASPQSVRIVLYVREASAVYLPLTARDWPG